MKKHFLDLKLKYKISLIMIPLLIVLILSIGFACGFYFLHLYSIDTKNSIESWLNITDQRIENIISQVMSTFLSSTSSEKMKIAYQKLEDDQYSKLATQYYFQDTLQSLEESNPFIENAYILDTNNNIYYSFSSSISDSNSKFLDYDTFANSMGISIYRKDKSPFKKDSFIIPVAFPITSISPSSYLVLAKDANPKIILVLMLDAQKIEEELNGNTSVYFNSSYSLFFNDINILDPNNTLNNTDKDFDIKKKTTSMQGLDLVMFINNEPIKLKKTSIILFSILLCIGVTILGIFLILYFASFLTRPFSKLSRMITQIKNNTYKLDEKPLFNDETGELIESINSMYVTIQSQIDRIKQDEKEKYNYMERILTEQINPHFIYNTLEVINMEVINGNTESASSMIQTFASYLRQSLNKGKELTTFKGEREHTNAYIDIMNHRLNKKIAFSFYISSELLETRIPKTIFQPLVENSIKHGFHSMEDKSILMPEITIKVVPDVTNIEISITDNGAGIDYERFYSSLENAGKNIGLYNIKRRLELFFGKTEIFAESIPFFKNTIKIVIHNEN